MSFEGKKKQWLIKINKNTSDQYLWDKENSNFPCFIPFRVLQAQRQILVVAICSDAVCKGGRGALDRKTRGKKKQEGEKIGTFFHFPHAGK